MSALAVTNKRAVIDVQPEAPIDLPPHSMDAEASVLSAAMLDRTAILKVVDFLRPEHFFSEAHRRIFEACLALHQAGTPLDNITVCDWLQDNGRLAQVGGAGYVTEILDACPVVANVRHHALIVYEKWRVRQVIVTAQKIAAIGYGDYGNAQEFCDRAATAMVNVAKQTVLGRPPSNLSVLAEIPTRLADGSEGLKAGHAAQPQRVRGLATGLYSYDKLTCGLHSGQKTTIVAHPGIGKTALAMQFAFNIADSGIGVVVFSTEMSQKEVLEREICRRAEIPFGRFQEGQLTASEWSRFAAASSHIGKLPIEIIENQEIDVDQICASTRAYAETMLVTHGVPLGLFVVDYVQNLKPAKSVEFKDERQQVTYSTKQLAKLSGDLGIPCLELAQRKQAEIDPKTKQRTKPAKGCAADTSWIEKKSYVVVCIQRDPLHNAQGSVIGEDERNLTLHLVKHRGGLERPVSVRFAGEFFRFTDPNEPSPTPARQYNDTEPESYREGLS